MGSVDSSHGRDRIALILAIGIATATNAITFAVLYDTIVSHGRSGISENGTQVLTLVFGGIIGVLGSYLGYRAGIHERGPHDPNPPEALAVPGSADRPSTGHTATSPGIDRTGPPVSDSPPEERTRSVDE